MKILITGKNSYIGNSFEEWIKKSNDNWNIDKVSVRDDSWRNINFGRYDVVIHVAGVAHVSTDPKMEELYYKINRDLAIQVAEKSKSDGVKQFIFMSSMIIYGESKGITSQNMITKDTKPNPVNFYGNSKLQADLAIQELSDEKFKSVIIRIPMVYGPGSKGNFPKLIKLSKITPVFPNLQNQRSMIYIDNLCEFMRLAIENKVNGVFFPQNRDYVATKDIIRISSQYMEKKVYFVSIFNFIIRVASKKVNTVNKVLGNRIYDKALSCDFDYKYCIVDFNESIKKSLGFK